MKTTELEIFAECAAGVPAVMVIDNGPSYMPGSLRDLLGDLGIAAPKAPEER